MSAGVPPPRVLLPFAIVTLIWGSTWLVIRDQLGLVPAAWSIAYRFLIAAAAMFAFAAATRAPLRLARRDHLLAAGVGIIQFVVNFSFVYEAERHITSGLVAVVFALLVVPNALLAWLFLGQRVTRPFLLGSAVALSGVALLFAHELRTAPLAAGEVAAGLALTLGGVVAASVANVMQAGARATRLAAASLLAWAMLYGALANVLLALVTVGAPRFEWRLGYVAGLLYLGLAASALAFSLYLAVMRAIGPARAAYSSVLVPVIAMTLSTLFEGYRWSLVAGAGGVLVLGGLLLALSARRPARKSG